MKAFAIFPIISVFIFTLTFLKIAGIYKPKAVLAFSIGVTIVFGTCVIIYSSEVFLFLYFFSFLSVILIIPSLTYLIYSNLPKSSSKQNWLRMLGIGLLATMVTLLVFAITFFYSFAYNPMDPPLIQ